MIFASSLPGFKSFMGKFTGKATDLACCTLFISTFILPTARRSVVAAAGSVLDDSRNAGWLLAWLAGSSRTSALLAAALDQLREAARDDSRRLHVLTIDSTQHGHQGHDSENTFSRGNTKPRSKKSNRKQKQHHRRSCHCFVFAVLLCPNGLRVPYYLPFYTKEYCKMRGWKHQSQASLAAQLIADIRLRPAVQWWLWATQRSRPSKSARPARSVTGAGWCR